MPELAGRTADAFEAGVREHEERWLSPLAVRSYETRGRAREEEPCLLRTPFQRDRDRIVHTKAFRRLMHKTQVFVDPAGDHYRTRLTHTLETTGISRGVARALRLNEDLVEAIGLGHDLGHTPFGHAGEEALDEALRERSTGASTTTSTRSGSWTCSSATAAASTSRRRSATGSSTTPGRTSRTRSRARSCAWSTASPTSTTTSTTPFAPACSTRPSCRDAEIELLGPTGSRRIDALVHDLVETSAREGDIRQSEEVGAAMLALRSFMFERVYLGEPARAEHVRARATVQRIFDHLLERGDSVDDVIDYVAGMTDRFALSYAESL